MPPSVLQVLLISAIPVGAAFLGATVAALRPPGRVVVLHMRGHETSIR